MTANKEVKFVMTPPLNLKVPELKGGLQYYDENRAPGYRCLWSVNWRIFDEDRVGGILVPLDRWKYNGQAPDPDFLPDEYLKAELTDIATRYPAKAANVEAHEAILFLHGYTGGNWRYDAVNFIVKSRAHAPEAISPYDPPRQTHWQVDLS